MAARQLPDAELLRKLLRYEPDTGKLYWEERTPDMFEGQSRLTALQRCKSWNRKNASNEALASSDGQGYKCGGLLGKPVKAHRIIWKLVTGRDPEFIDHINGSRDDNRWSNLRAATKIENAKNCKVRRDNEAGCPGVGARNGKWRARICVGGRRFSLGLFDSLEEAIRVRKSAERRFGFHPNHGRRS